jgi:AraC-like DNA-binding protein
MFAYIFNVVDSLLLLTLVFSVIAYALVQSFKYYFSAYRILLWLCVFHGLSALLSLLYFQPSIFVLSERVLSFPSMLFVNIAHFLLPLVGYKVIIGEITHDWGNDRVVKGYCFLTLLIVSFFSLRILFPHEGICASAVQCLANSEDYNCTSAAFCIASNLVGIAALITVIPLVATVFNLYTFRNRFLTMETVFRFLAVCYVLNWCWGVVTASLIALDIIQVESTTIVSLLLDFICIAFLMLWLVQQVYVSVTRKVTSETLASTSKPANIEAKFSVLEDYIDDQHPQFQANMTLTRMAEAVGLSRNDVSYLINQRYGMSFSDFVNSQRIKKAKELLLDNKAQLSIQEVFTVVGFNSKTTFNSVFKKATGMTPSKFRESKH